MAHPDAFDGLYVSVSQVKCYLRCPRQFELKYVRGVAPAFVPVPFAFGLAFHGAAAAMYSDLKLSGSMPVKDMVVDTFRDAWARASLGPLQDDEDEPVDLGTLADKGVAMVEVLHAHTVKTINGHEVEAVEMPFNVALYDPSTGEVQEEKLIGTVDLVLRHGDQRTIVEHKTSSRRWSDDQLAHDLQPTAYKLAARQAGLGEVGLRLQVVTKVKQPQMQAVELERGEADEADFVQTALGVLRAIDAGAFWPNRGWQCRSCPYSGACR